MVTTIMPKNEKCDVQELGFFGKTIGGTCYDKMFSGHFAFGLLFTMLAFQFGFLSTSTTNIVFYVLVNLLHALIIPMTRGHYTMDVIISLYVTLLIQLSYTYFDLNKYVVG